LTGVICDYLILGDAGTIMNRIISGLEAQR
jgi:hypothetical protein